MAPPLFRASYPDAATLVAELKSSGSGLLIRGASLEQPEAMSACRVRVEITGAAPWEVDARVAAVVPGVGVAVLFDDPGAVAQLAESPPAGANDEEQAQGPLSERLKAMNATEKMQLALSGSRDERMALLRDFNKTLHVYVLKNPRIGLDEIQYAAKQPNLSPDALKLIAEHREWGLSPGVCTSLVRNPKTPLPLALRLIDRLPPAEVRALAKGGARDQVVHAARRKVTG